MEETGVAMTIAFTLVFNMILPWCDSRAVLLNCSAVQKAKSPLHRGLTALTVEKWRFIQDQPHLSGPLDDARLQTQVIYTADNQVAQKNVLKPW